LKGIQHNHFQLFVKFFSAWSDKSQIECSRIPLEPSGQVGVDRVVVDFEVDKQRVLLATVRDLLNGQVLVENGAIAQGALPQAIAKLK